MAKPTTIAAFLIVLGLAAFADDPPVPQNPGATDDPRALGVSDLRDRLLGESTPGARALAAGEILRRGEPEAVAAIREGLKSGNEGIVTSVLEAIAAQHDGRFAPEVATLVTHAKETVARAAAEAVAALPGKPMAAALADAFPRLVNGIDLHKRLVAALGATRSRHAVPFLLTLLEGQPEEISAEAQKSLFVITRARCKTRAEWDEWWRGNGDRGRERWLEDALAGSGNGHAPEADVGALLAAVRTLKTEIVQLRIEAARKNGDPSAEVALLRELLEDKKFVEVRARILEELAKVGRARSGAALPVVARLLDDPDRKVVLAAIRCLGEIGDAGSADAIARFLTPQQDAEARGAAARALARVATPNVVDFLVASLNETDPAVLLALLEGVKTVHARPALPRIQQILRDHRAEPELVKAAIEALGDIGDPEAVPIVVGFLAGSQPEKDQKARWAAANSLGKLRSPAAVDALIALLDDPFNDLRQAAVEALGRIGDPRATESLAKTVGNDKDPVVRELAAQSLGALKNPAAIEVLVQALSDPEPKVARFAWSSILAVADKDPLALESLVDKLLAAKHPHEAIEALRLLAPAANLTPESLTPHQTNAQIRLGNALFDAKEWKEAQGVLETSQKWWPDNRDVKRKLGVVYRELSNADAAFQVFSALLEGLEPGSAEWWQIKSERLAVRLLRKEYEFVLAEIQRQFETPNPPIPDDVRARLEALRGEAQAGSTSDQQRHEELRRKVLDVVARSRGADEEALKSLAAELAAIGRDAVPLLLGILKEGDPADWAAASHHLSVMTNLPAAIAADTPKDRRDKAMAEWEKWLNGGK